jgi:hypothetical protein
VSRAAYHGGDFNGVACRWIVGNARDRIRTIIMAKKMQNAMIQQYTMKQIRYSKC